MSPRPVSPRLPLSLLALLVLVPLCSASPAAVAGATPTRPAKITTVHAKPGPRAGEITFTWSQAGAHATYYRVETALTNFSKTDPSVPKYGRHAYKLYIKGYHTSYTMSAAQTTAAGAGPGSGNHLYFRFFAVNANDTLTSTRAYPYLQWVMGKPVATKAAGTPLRVASFNVRTAKATDDSRNWLARAGDVATEITSHQPGVVALQELGPGRADGKAGSTTGTARQTDSLEAALRQVGAARFQLVRTTPYVKPGVAQGTQGMRILYDTSRYTLLSRCSDSSAGGNYSGSCTIVLPLIKGDSENERRRAAYAELADKRSGARFFFVSTHLDARRGANATTEQRFDQLRGDQARAITTAMSKMNTARRPVIVGGDYNSYQTHAAGNSAHDRLISAGYLDTANAASQVNIKYSTFNNFATRLTASQSGYGSRLDALLTKDVGGAKRYENVTRPTDRARPSDHDLVLADLVL